MSDVYVVMGREFYSSWPVRVFTDEAAAEAFAGSLRRRYLSAQEINSSDIEQSRALGDSVVEPKDCAARRAQEEMRAHDPRAGGLELTWDVEAVPMEPRL